MRTNTIFICPVCGSAYDTPPAFSRRRDHDIICPMCGCLEAMEDLVLSQPDLAPDFSAETRARLINWSNWVDPIDGAAAEVRLLTTGEVGPITDLYRLAGMQFGLLVLRNRDRPDAAVEALMIAERTSTELLRLRSLG